MLHISCLLITIIKQVIYNNFPPPLLSHPLSAVMCPQLQEPVDGFLRITGLAVGAETVYFCDSGFQRNGLLRRECLPTGNWSGSETVCDRELNHDWALTELPKSCIGLKNFKVLWECQFYYIEPEEILGIWKNFYFGYNMRKVLFYLNVPLPDWMTQKTQLSPQLCPGLCPVDDWWIRSKGRLPMTTPLPAPWQRTLALWDTY